MFGLGGATVGRVWCDYDFLENHARLDINRLHQAGALINGTETACTWEGRKAYLRAVHGRIILSGDREQTILVDWLPILDGRYERPRFLCAGCGRGCYHLCDKAGTFFCRNCCRYDFKSRHRQRFSPAFRRIAKLRGKLGADPSPLSPLPPPPRQRMSRKRFTRLAAALARAEVAAYGDLGRLLANLDQRAKSKATPHD